MSSVPFTLSAMLLVVCLSAGFSGAVESEKLKSHPHLRCSACRAICEEVQERMNKTVEDNKGARIKVSHRLHKGDEQWKVYKGSQFHASDVIESSCKDLDRTYRLKVGDDGVRRFSKNSSHTEAEMYNKKERDLLDDAPKILKLFCMELLDEFDEQLTRLIKADTALEEMQEALCTKTTKLCSNPMVRKSVADEMERKAKYDARQKQKEEKLKKEREAEEAKRKADEEAEEAKRKAAEAEAAANAAATADGSAEAQPSGSAETGEAPAAPTPAAAEAPVNPEL